MKDGPQSGLTFYGMSHTIGPLCKDLPLGIGHAMFWSDASGILGSHGITIGVVAQYNQVIWPTHLGEQPGSAYCGRFAFSKAARIVQIDADPGRQQLEVACLKFLPQLIGIGGHEPPIPQFGTLIPRLVHFVEHPGISPTLPFHILDDSPRNGSITHTDLCVCHCSLLLYHGRAATRAPSPRPHPPPPLLYTKL